MTTFDALPAAQRPKIRLVAGDDWARVRVRWSADGVAIPISAARLQVRKRADASRALVELTEDDGLDLDVEGEVGITFTAAQTAGLSNGVYALEVTRASTGKVRTLIAGELEVVEDATR